MSFLQTEQKTIFVKFLRGFFVSIMLLGTFCLPLFGLPFTKENLSFSKGLFLIGLVLLALFVWFLEAAVSKRLVIRQTIFDWPLLVLVIVILLTTIFSRVQGISWLGRTDSFVFNFATVLSLVTWFWLLAQSVRASMIWRLLLKVFLLSTVVVGLLFLLRDYSWLQPILNGWFVVNPISNSNGLFAIFMALAGVLGVGMILVKNSGWLASIIPVISTGVVLTCLLKLGFVLGWQILAVGLGLLLIVGFTVLSETRTPVLLITFVLFLSSVLLIIFGTPKFFQPAQLVDVALGSSASWEITRGAWLQNSKTIFLGTGPGTFREDFSQFRPAAFNYAGLMWSQRFSAPYNSIFGLLAETGVLGALSFVFVVLLGIGGIFGAWFQTRPRTFNQMKNLSGEIDPAVNLLRTEVFVLSAVLLAATFGLFVAYYDLTLWWLWWFLFGLSAVGISAFIPAFIKERVISLSVSPQYALAVSFAMILFFTGLLIIGVMGSRIYLAEVFYQRASQAKDLNQSTEYLKKAIVYRSKYAPYYRALALNSLQLAKGESVKAKPEVALLGQFMSDAVNAARTATDYWPNDVEAWETRGIAYLNAKALATDAVRWAKESFVRAVQLEPTNPMLHWRLGQMQLVDKQEKEAEESYRRAMELKTDFLPAYAQLSELLEQQNRVDEAINLYEPIFETIKTNPEFLFNLGRLFYNRNQAGDLARAEQIWLEAVRLDPNYSNALYSLGLLYEKNGKKSLATEYFEKVKALNPSGTTINK